MDLLKHKRSGFTGVVTRIFNKAKPALEEDLFTLNLRQLERQVDSVLSADISYRKLHDELHENFLSDINLREEQHNLEQHEESEESVEKTLSVVNQLIAFYEVYSNSIHIRAKLDTLERQLKDQPENSFQVVISKLQERFEAVEHILRDSKLIQLDS